MRTERKHASSSNMLSKQTNKNYIWSYIVASLHYVSLYCVSLSPSSQSAARISPIHAEADRTILHLGKGSDGVTGKETL